MASFVALSRRACIERTDSTSVPPVSMRWTEMISPSLLIAVVTFGCARAAMASCRLSAMTIPARARSRNPSMTPSRAVTTDRAHCPCFSSGWEAGACWEAIASFTGPPATSDAASAFSTESATTVPASSPRARAIASSYPSEISISGGNDPNRPGNSRSSKEAVASAGATVEASASLLEVHRISASSACWCLLRACTTFSFCARTAAEAASCILATSWSF